MKQWEVTNDLRLHNKFWKLVDIETPHIIIRYFELVRRYSAPFPKYVFKLFVLLESEYFKWYRTYLFSSYAQKIAI